MTDTQLIALRAAIETFASEWIREHNALGTGEQVVVELTIKKFPTVTTQQSSPSTKEVLGMPVQKFFARRRMLDVGFSNRLHVNIKNFLIQEGITTVEDLLQKTPEEVLRSRPMGPKSLRAIQELLARQGLRLENDDYELPPDGK